MLNSAWKSVVHANTTYLNFLFVYLIRGSNYYLYDPVSALITAVLIRFLTASSLSILAQRVMVLTLICRDSNVLNIKNLFKVSPVACDQFGKAVSPCHAMLFPGKFVIFVCCFCVVIVCDDHQTATSFVDHLCFCVLCFSCFRVCSLLPCGRLRGKG